MGVRGRQSVDRQIKEEALAVNQGLHRYLRVLIYLDFDSAFLGFLCLRKSDGEDAVLAFGLDVLLVNVFRKCEGSGEGWS